MDKVITFEYREEINLSLKAVFLLKQIFKLSNQELRGYSKHDWLHQEYNTLNGKDEFKSTDTNYWELIDSKLIKSVKMSEGQYFKYTVTDKARKIISQVELTDTSIYNSLIPENFNYE